MKKKILLLGAGELGKEFVIAAQRLGQYVIAVDSYNDAPAQQVAHERAVINMLDGTALDVLVQRYQPDIIVPEIEAIRTENFYAYEQQGIQVVPSARAANFTMNRRAIRDLASRELGLHTAPYAYASTFAELTVAVAQVGIPCVVKPLMSSSGKGQSVIKSAEDITTAWNYAMTGSRGDVAEVIVEAFINFYAEITLLTVTQRIAPTLFCPPIGHRQERGDYRESWQPHSVNTTELAMMQHMAQQVTEALGGCGLWGVEFFLSDTGVYFSELSPRPHDTGMVTLAGTQNLNEFELHLRAILGLPIPKIILERAGASAVILASQDGVPQLSGIEQVLASANAEVRIFGKPTMRPQRRMGVVLIYDKLGSDMNTLITQAKNLADQVQVKNESCEKIPPKAYQ